MLFCTMMFTRARHVILTEPISVPGVRAPKWRENDQWASDRFASEHAQELSVVSRERPEFFRRVFE